MRFADSDALGGYFTVDDALPADLELTRSVGKGELLPRAAVGTPDETGLVEVPVAVEPELVPPDVESGDLVDVYVVAPISADAQGKEQQPPPAGPALAGVDEDAAPAFFALLARYDAPSLTVVRRG